MTAETAAHLKPGVEVYCQAPGRVFHNHKVVVVRVDSYEGGVVFVMGRLPAPPREMGQEAYVFEPGEIEMLQ